MPTPVQVRNRFIMKTVAKGIVYGLSTKVIAEKLKRSPQWVRKVQKHPRFPEILDEVESEIYNTSEREISTIRSKSLKVLRGLLNSSSPKILLEAYDRATKLHEFKQGLGSGGLGGAVEESGEEESDEEYLLSEGAISTAFKLLEATPKDAIFVDAKIVDEEEESS